MFGKAAEMLSATRGRGTRAVRGTCPSQRSPHLLAEEELDWEAVVLAGRGGEGGEQSASGQRGYLTGSKEL